MQDQTNVPIPLRNRISLMCLGACAANWESSELNSVTAGFVIKN